MFTVQWWLVFDKAGENKRNRHAYQLDEERPSQVKAARMEWLLPKQLWSFFMTKELVSLLGGVIDGRS
jgi:hypothetical protein